MTENRGKWLGTRGCVKFSLSSLELCSQQVACPQINVKFKGIVWEKRGSRKF